EALFSLVEGDMHLGEVGVHAEVAVTDLSSDPAVVGDDGELRLVIAPPGTPGATLETDPKSRFLLIRQYLYDWDADRVASFSIERVDRLGVPAPPPRPEGVADALDRAARWVEESLTYW